MSVILQAPVLYQTSLTDVQKTEITNYINQYRAAHQAPNLSWDNNIANFSQTWANYLINNNLFQHSGSQLYGENLAYFKGYGTDIMTLLKLSIDLWYQEISSYNFTQPGFSSETGHFTCLIWKQSTTFGMGISILDDTVVVSYNTSPPCNIIGEFETNVLPKLTNANIPTPTPIPQPIPQQPIPTQPQYPMQQPMQQQPQYPMQQQPQYPMQQQPQYPTQQPEHMSVPLSKMLKIVTTIHKIIEELKRPNANRIMITHHLKQIIKDLIHHSSS